MEQKLNKEIEQKLNEEIQENINFTSEELRYYVNYIISANRILDKYDAKTLKLSSKLKEKFEKINALKKFDKFILDNTEITKFHYHEYNNDVIIKKNIKQVYDETRLLLNDWVTSAQTYWTKCKCIENPIIVSYIEEQIRSKFGKIKYQQYILRSRSYRHVKLFVSFIYKNILPFLSIKYDLNKLHDCPVMKFILVNVTYYFEHSFIQN